MNDADEFGHRYETSPERVLSVVPPPDLGHGITATRLMAWFITAGHPLEQIVQGAGVRIPGPNTDGGRIPDLTILSTPRPSTTLWLSPDDLLLVIEVISPGSAATDQLIKVAEYAKARIPRYWTVARDEQTTVTLFQLRSNDTYETVEQMPLADLLKSSPDKHLPWL
jgi:Uma2 family endonuclease